MPTIKSDWRAVRIGKGEGFKPYAGCKCQASKLKA
jgi:hypothetical protein